MKKNWPIVVIALVAVIIILAVILRKQIKGGNGKNTGGSGASQGAGNNQTTTPKIAYADRDKVNVYTSQLTLYKTAKEDEWIGTVDGERSVFIPGKYNPDTNQWESGTSFDAYVLKGDRLVDKNDVYLQ